MSKRSRSGRARKRILYIQYTSPSGYPPLINGSRILADAGWKVHLLGVSPVGTASMRFPTLPDVTVRIMWINAKGWLPPRLHYLLFLCWVLARGIAFRPSWVYASDPFSTPGALALRRFLGCNTAYHEHDKPGHADSRAMRAVLKRRQGLLSVADLVIAPSAGRMADLSRADGRGPRLVISNFPSSSEVIPVKSGDSTGPFRLWYHGSLGPHLLPLELLDALARLDEITLTAAGYETVGTRGFVHRLRSRARELRIEGRLEILGPMDRQDLIRRSATAHVGLALFDEELTRDGTLIGASNKPYDYMAGSLALLVPDSEDWVQTFVEPGYGRACDPRDVRSLVNALEWMVSHVDEVNEMGRSGRRRILDDWNYERQFEPALRYFEET